MRPATVYPDENGYTRHADGCVGDLISRGPTGTKAFRLAEEARALLRIGRSPATASAKRRKLGYRRPLNLGIIGSRGRTIAD
jgi:hypothetical protein